MRCRVAVLISVAIVAGACASAGDEQTASRNAPETTGVSPAKTAGHQPEREATQPTEPEATQPTEPAEALLISGAPDQLVRLRGELVGASPPFFLQTGSQDDAWELATGFNREMIITSEWPTTIAIAPGTTSFSLRRRDGQWLIEPSATDTNPVTLRPRSSITMMIQVSTESGDLPPEGDYFLKVPIAFWTNLDDEAISRAADGVTTLELTYTVLPVAYTESLSKFCAVAITELTDHYLLSSDELLDRLDTIQQQTENLNSSDQRLVTSDIGALSEALLNYLAGERGFSTSALVEDINILCGSSLAATASEVGE